MNSKINTGPIKTAKNTQPVHTNVFKPLNAFTTITVAMTIVYFILNASVKEKSWRQTVEDSVFAIDHPSVPDAVELYV